MPPVKWLMHWHPNPGATLNSQILAEACGCAEALGGAKDGRWKTSIFFYRPMTRDGGVAGAAGQQQQQHPDVPRELLGVALHERPGLYFSIVRAQRLVLQADAAFPQVMEKLQSYKARVALNFEGFQYQLGDFCLRIGKCVPNNSEALRGIMMEVEYYPLSSIEKSRAIMEDFFDIWQETIAKKSLPGHFIHVESNFSDYGLSDQYSFQHTAVQYATCLQQLMAAVDGITKVQVLQTTGIHWLPNEMSFMKFILSKARLLRNLSFSHADKCLMSHEEPLHELQELRLKLRSCLKVQLEHIR